MAQLSEFLTPADLQKISNLQVLARLVVEGFCTGLHRSPHKGFSVEFKQHRQYVHGDEIRHLDWRIYGKTDRFYIREYEEETNLRATIISAPPPCGPRERRHRPRSARSATAQSRRSM